MVAQCVTRVRCPIANNLRICDCWEQTDGSFVMFLRSLACSPSSWLFSPAFFSISFIFQMIFVYHSNLIENHALLRWNETYKVTYRYSKLNKLQYKDRLFFGTSLSLVWTKINSLTTIFIKISKTIVISDLWYKVILVLSYLYKKYVYHSYIYIVQQLVMIMFYRFNE